MLALPHPPSSADTHDYVSSSSSTMRHRPRPQRLWLLLLLLLSLTTHARLTRAISRRRPPPPRLWLYCKVSTVESSSTLVDVQRQAYAAPAGPREVMRLRGWRSRSVCVSVFECVIDEIEQKKGVAALLLRRCRYIYAAPAAHSNLTPFPLFPHTHAHRAARPTTHPRPR